jgi:aerobic carbon-monoxide dehydrogenase medium subunit
MKPASFDAVRASSIAEACNLLAEFEGRAKVVAGAQSLGPMLNLRLVQPSTLIDITGIPAMTRLEEDNDAITLGACITTGNIEDGRVPNGGLSMLAAVAMGTAYRAVRNRGTIGGSVCHADPAADWVSALSALGAQCLIAGVARSRILPIEHFVTGAFETALGHGELLEAIRIPRLSSQGRWGYAKLCRKAGEFAMAIGAVLYDPPRERYRLVIGATHGRPIVVDNARTLLREKQSSGSSLSLDQGAVLDLLEQGGVVDSVARLRHSEILKRAFDQAMQS